ncbi:MAG: NAD(P)/FAD-dependent oxidoreductase [Bdellovibrionales bacterium]
MSRSCDALVVGAGLSGLALAHRLQRAQKKVIVLEKSRGVGGRMATRRDGQALYDHGAQFFKVSSNSPSALVTEWRHGGLLRSWFLQDGCEYLSSVSGMTAGPKLMARDLDLRLETRVVSLKTSDSLDSTIQVLDEKETLWEASRVYLTCPLPQSLKILEDSKISFPSDLKTLHYAKALVGLFELEPTPGAWPSPGYVELASSSIFSISHQGLKGLSPVPTLVVVMQPEWSELRFKESDEKTLQSVMDEFQIWFRRSFQGQSLLIKKAQLKKWRYSHPLKTAGRLFDMVGPHGLIYLLGDAFGGGSLSGALRSAEAIPVSSTV